MNKQEFEQELQKIKQKNTQKEYKKILDEEKDKYKNKSKIETSKLIMFYLLILLNAIIVYSMVAMWNFADLTYLGVLISDIAAQVLVYIIYCLKAFHGKKQEEDMKFKREKLSGTLQNIIQAGQECVEPLPLTEEDFDTFGSYADTEDIELEE